MLSLSIALSLSHSLIYLSLEVHCSRCLWTFSITVHFPPLRLIWHHVKCSGCFCSCLCIYVPFHTFLKELHLFSHSPPPLPHFFFSQSAFLQLPSWQTGKQAASLSPMLFLGVLSTHSTEHRDIQTQTCSHQSNTIYSNGSAADTNTNPLGPSLCGMTQVCLAWTQLARILFINMSLLILVPNRMPV